MQVIPIRLFYYKKDRLKYISHLDTVGVFEKAIARSGLPVWFTKGYNPHAYISILLPISLGYEGRKEPVDIRLTQQVDFKEILQKLNQFLPQDMQIIGVSTPVEEASEISWADYQILIEKANGEKLEEKFQDFFTAEEIIVQKKTKKAVIDLDIKPYIENMEITTDEENLILRCRIATGEPININPRLLIKAFEVCLGQELDGVQIIREQIYNKLYQLFE